MGLPRQAAILLSTKLVATTHLHSVLFVISTTNLSSLALVFYWLAKSIRKGNIRYTAVSSIFEIGFCVLEVDISFRKLCIEHIPDIETQAAFLF